MPSEMSDEIRTTPTDSEYHSETPRENAASNAEPTPPVYRWLLLVTILLIAWRIFPGEVAHWHFDAHKNHLLNDDLESALVSIKKAVEWQPTNPGYWSALGGVEMELDNYAQSWEGFDRARQIIQESELYSNKEAAIAVAQNNSAYARALGNTELDQARMDIDAALEVLPHTGSWLDTRGYIRLLQGDLDGALEDTHSAVTQSEATYKLREREIEAESTNVVRRRQINFELRSLNEELAVLYNHRAMVYEALGQAETAARDFEFSEAYQTKADGLRHRDKEL